MICHPSMKHYRNNNLQAYNNAYFILNYACMCKWCLELDLQDFVSHLHQTYPLEKKTVCVFNPPNCASKAQIYLSYFILYS